ncbi:MAG: hypothetical protein U0K70_03700, partial [Acutalibacteraceae bacterium]|nr:hypothetical protein [Acutalibacteraceae bacterium]
MQKGKVLSLKNFKLADFVARNNILTILVVLIAGGIAVGIFTQSKIQLLSEYSADYLERFIALRSGESFVSVALSSFMGSALVLLLLFAAGTSMLGVVLVPLLTAVRGMFFGGVSA